MFVESIELSSTSGSVVAHGALWPSYTELVVVSRIRDSGSLVLLGAVSCWFLKGFSHCVCFFRRKSKPLDFYGRFLCAK